MSGITTLQIKNNNDKIPTHHDIELSKFIMNWINNGKIEFPRWQREDCWNDYYRVKLIESIMTQTDLPKFYLSKMKDQDKFYLLDGGHRTRTIKSYINNEFNIIIDDINVYYDTLKGSLRKNRIMNEHEKSIFDKYYLSITIYENLSEKESRKIFNDLQNCQPMSMADIVNSHESYLVDYLRTLENLSIDGQHLSIYFDNSPKLPNSSNSGLLYQLASWWTIVFPDGIDEKEKLKESFKWCLKGESKDKSSCYHYIKRYEDEITQKQKEYFEGMISMLIRQIKSSSLNDKKERPNIPVGECSSILHANIYIKNFSISKYEEFIKDFLNFQSFSKDCIKYAKENNNIKQIECSRDAENINKKYNGIFTLQTWNRSNMNTDKMRQRYNTFKEFCVYEDGENLSSEDDLIDIDELE